MFGFFVSFILGCFVLIWLGIFVFLVMLGFSVVFFFVRVANPFNLICLSNIEDVN